MQDKSVNQPHHNYLHPKIHPLSIHHQTLENMNTTQLSHLLAKM